MTLLHFSAAGAHPVPDESRNNPDLYLRAFVVPAYVPAPFVKSSNPSLTLFSTSTRFLAADVPPLSDGLRGHLGLSLRAARMAGPSLGIKVRVDRSLLRFVGKQLLI